MGLIQNFDGVLPFWWVNADEMILLALLKKRYAFAHQRIKQNNARHIAWRLPGNIKRLEHSWQIIAVKALHVPAK